MKTVSNFKVPDLNELYSRTYDESMNRWRQLGAIDKARNLSQITGDVPKPLCRVLEVGCGNGAVLRELAAEGFGSDLVGIEIGKTRSKEEKTRINGAALHIHGYDGARIPYDDCSFDLVYATHVLEHVLDERGFLSELRRVSRAQVYLEVPCELGLRASRRSLQKTLDIGHINSYTPESFALTIETCGLIVRQLKVFDHSFALYRFAAPRWKAVVKLAVRRTLLSANATLASRILAYHCGAVCERSSERSTPPESPLSFSQE
jgi:ubiquinone/menaquinone biosynthesis C-methylase UbiE